MAARPQRIWPPQGPYTSGTPLSSRVGAHLGAVRWAMRGEFQAAVHECLSNQGWICHTCSRCNRQFYSARGAPTCQSPECERQYRFAIGPEARGRVSAKELWRRAAGFLGGRQFTLRNQDSVVNDFGDTLFIVAGVQVLNPIIHGGLPITNARFGVAQPSIRLQYLDSVAREEGV